MESVAESLTAIHKTLEKQWKQQNEIMRQIVDYMPRPANKFTRIMETIVLVTSALGIIIIADIIVKWIIGG